MEAEQKHSCKVCGKTFSSPRSLGGHMSSHLSLAATGPPVPAATAYGLRENPKKTRRFSDSIPSGASSPSRDKLCRECGRGFLSWNALFGHMSSHARERKSRARVAGEEEEDESLSDDEGVVALRRARRRSRRVAAIPASWSSEVCEKEQEDVAVSLMMLSRDFRSWSGVIAAGESSDKNSVVWDGKGVADEEFEVERGKMGSELGNGRFRDGVIIVEDEDVPKRAKLDAFDAHVSELLEGELPNSGVAEVKRKARFFQCDSEAELRTWNKKMRLGDGRGGHIVRDGYQCATCKKIFQSYQALGGHRASYHKKLKSCETSGIDVGSENNSKETDATIEAEAVSPKGRVDYCNLGLKNKVKVHECPICHKVFPSGQALGGHKRLHLIVNAGNGGSSSTVFCNLGRKSSMGSKNMDKAHECPICHKVFPSGQALGGHKSQSHLIVNAGSSSSSSRIVFPQTIVIQHQNQPPGMPDLIDLNLPAPVDKESTSTDHGNVEFKPW